MHYLAVGENADKFSGSEYVVDIDNNDYSDIDEPKFIKDDLKNFTFIDKIDYQASIIFDHKIDIKILGYNLFHTTEDPNAYNNWNSKVMKN
jgi:hypothetical protein